MSGKKVTFEDLSSHIWKASDILRGSLDASDYRQPVMALLFLKRLNDRFEENVESLLSKGKTEKQVYSQKFLHDFFIPENARWSVLSNASKNIGEEIDAICKIIEKENPQLDGVLTSTKYNDKKIGRAHV